MGPRLVSRGKEPGQLKPRSPWRLQWGRDLLVAESGLTAVMFRPLACASMGPRLVSRGKPVGLRWRVAWVRASMGPRLVSRGKAIGGCWSHRVSNSFNGAATC